MTSFGILKLTVLDRPRISEVRFLKKIYPWLGINFGIAKFFQKLIPRASPGNGLTVSKAIKSQTIRYEWILEKLCCDSSFIRLISTLLMGSSKHILDANNFFQIKMSSFDKISTQACQSVFFIVITLFILKPDFAGSAGFCEKHQWLSWLNWIFKRGQMSSNRRMPVESG